MDFPDRGAPATGGGTGEAAVIIHVQVHIVDHKLIDNFDLLALQRIHAGNGPLGIASVGRHFRDDAGFVYGPWLAEDWLWLVLQDLSRQRRVKTEADVEVIAVRKLQLAIVVSPIEGLPPDPLPVSSTK